MLTSLLRFSTRQSGLVILLSLTLIASGIYHFQRLPIDAVPDITNVQIQINTAAPGYSPLETEQRITFPIETLVAGMPRLHETRSLSKYGLSQVTVVFEEGTDIYFARQQVGERLRTAGSQLPPGIDPEMGPISTGLGEIFMWTVKAQAGALTAEGKPYTPVDLRTLQDWVIRPQLRNLPGIAEINAMGGYQKQIHITPQPEKLQAYQLRFEDLISALENNNANVGAGYIERNGEQYLVRVPGQVKTPEDIANIVVKNKGNVPIRVKQLATVQLGRELRTGAATQDGEEVVLGTAVMLLGSNSRDVAHRVGEKLKEVNKSLPAGVVAEPVYDRTLLVDKAIHTVEKNLVEGALLVVAILFLFLGNFRAALITAMIIPLAMCVTLTGMVKGGISANLMSLGALDFGIIVDGAVVIVENALRRMALRQQSLGHVLNTAQRQEVVFEASQEASKEILFGQLIIMMVYIPILSLTGVEGKMFGPMALTVIIAMVGAMVLSFSFVPAAITLFIRGRVTEKENRLLLWLKGVYRPTLSWVMRYPKGVFASTLVLLGLCSVLALSLGTEFVPSLNEGDIVIQPVRIPGTSLSQSVEMEHALDKALNALPETERVFARIGTAEIASDPMSPNEVDTFVMLKERDQWPDPKMSQAALIQKIEGVLDEMPGSVYEFTQPIEMRFNELIAGVRSDVAVKVFGDDTQILLRHAHTIAGILNTIPGASDVKVEQAEGLPMLTLEIQYPALSRYGITVTELQNLVEVAIGGKPVGQIFEGDRRFDMVVRLPEQQRQNIEELKRLPVPLPQGNGVVPLSNLVDFQLKPGPNQISREQGKRRIVVTANVRGRDMGSFVNEAQERISEKVSLDSGYWLTWGGQFEQMLSAANRLKVVIPIALGVIIVLLFLALNHLKDALLVFSGVPLALTGGIVALWVRQMPLSISAGIGFIALSGVAVLNGLVLISFIKHLREEGTPLVEAVKEGTLVRLRPGTHDGTGGLPGLYSHGPGTGYRL